MTAQLLKGRQRAKQLQAELSRDFSELAAATGVQPALAALQVGADPAAAGILARNSPRLSGCWRCSTARCA